MPDHGAFRCFDGWMGYQRPNQPPPDPCPHCQPWHAAKLDGQVELIGNDPRQPFPDPPRLPDGRATVEYRGEATVPVFAVLRCWTDEQVRELIERDPAAVSMFEEEAAREADSWMDHEDSDVTIRWAR